MGADLLEVIHALVQRETNLNLAAIQNAKEVTFFYKLDYRGRGFCEFEKYYLSHFLLICSNILLFTLLYYVIRQIIIIYLISKWYPKCIEQYTWFTIVKPVFHTHKSV